MADSRRLLSLDVFRGITIAGMILVNSPGNETCYWPLDHSEWNGLTPTDLVFPFFVFIVGVSLTLSLAKRMERGDEQTALLWQVVKRTLIIFGLGLLLNGFPYYHLDTLRYLGVLQRIALCYFFGSLFFLFTNAAVQIAVAIALLIGYHWLMLHTAVPGFGVGNLTKEGNLAAFLDRSILAAHTYRPQYDPEGLLSTLPAIASVLFGNLAGLWLRSKGLFSQKINGFIQAGIIFIVVGLKWSHFFPVNKALWSSSYVMVTTGLASLLLALCIWLNEMKGWSRWSKPFEALGTNALAAYFLHVLFLKIQNLIKLSRPDGSAGNLRLFITDHLFRPWLDSFNASLAYALGYTLLWITVFGFLYRRKIFIKV
jgi:predicted acyltransferase